MEHHLNKWLSQLNVNRHSEYATPFCSRHWQYNYQNCHFSAALLYGTHRIATDCTSASRCLPLNVTVLQWLVEAKLLLFLSETQLHEDVWGGVGIIARWRWTVSFTLRPVYPQRRNATAFLRGTGTGSSATTSAFPCQQYSNTAPCSFIHPSPTELTASLTNTLVRFLVTWFYPAPA